MKKISLTFFLLLCISCTSNPARQELNPYINQSITIHWMKVPDPNAYCRQIDPKMAAISNDKKILGCAHWSKIKPECKIVTGLKDDLVTIGHEMKHCFVGEWHQ
jgi:glutamate racemase